MTHTKSDPRPGAVAVGALLAMGIAGVAGAVAAADGAYGLDGFTEPYRSIEVAAPEPGVLAALEVREGALVKKGATLARLDTRALEAARHTSRLVAGAVARLQAAQAQLRLSETRLRKLDGLAASGNARGDEVAVARAELDKAHAEISAVEEMRAVERQKLAEIESGIEERTLRSPIDGVVIKIHHQVGEFVGAGEMRVVTVVQLDPLSLNVFAPAASFNALVVRNKVDVQCGDGPARQAEVEFVSPVVDAESGTARCKLVLPNADGALRSGIRCSVVAANPTEAHAEGNKHE